MDGVVIDTEQVVTAFWQRLAEQHDVHLTDEIFDRHILGSPSTHTLDQVFPHLTAEQRLAVQEDLEHSETHQTYVAVTGVVKLLHDLHQHSIATALVTSGMRWKVDAVAQQLGLQGLFTTLVTAEDIERGKPDPECYRLAAQRLGVVTDGCIVFEDAVNGVKAAVAAGTFCVGVRAARLAPVLLETGAKYVVPDFSTVRWEAAGDGAFSLRLSDDCRLPLSLGG
jgi:HAD superfamily hydrolase (TIGR01509 family)